MVSLAVANAVNNFSFNAQNSLRGFGIAGRLAPFQGGIIHAWAFSA